MSRSELESNIQDRMNQYHASLADMKGRMDHEFTSTKAEYDALARDLRMNQTKLSESLAHLKSDLRLELSVERGKQREAGQAMSLKLAEAQLMMDQEVGAVRSSLSKVNYDIYYTLIGITLSSAAAFLAYLRFIA